MARHDRDMPCRIAQRAGILRQGGMPPRPHQGGAWTAFGKSISGKMKAGCVAGLLGLAAGAVQAQTVEFHLDLDTGGHRAVIRDVVASADGAVIVSASDDKTVRIWNGGAGESTAVLRGQMGPGGEGVVNAVALSADAGAVAVGGYFAGHQAAQGPFGDVRIFDVQSGAIRSVLRGHELVVETLAYDAGRDELAVSGQGGQVHRWAAPFSDAPQALPVLDTQSWRVSRVDYALNGQRLIVATYDYGLRIWDLDNGAEIAAPDAEALWDTPLVALAVSADGALFALADDQGRVTVREAATGAVIAALPQRPFRVDALGFSGDRLVLSCGYRCGDSYGSETWDWATGTMLTEYRAQDGGVHALAILPEGRVVTAGGRLNRLDMWDVSTGQAMRQMGGISAPVAAVGLSAMADRIGWGADDPCPTQAICPTRMGELTQEMELPTAERAFEKPGPRGAARLGRAVIELPGLKVALDSEPGTGFDGSRLRISDAAVIKGGDSGYYHSAYSFVPGLDRVISGGGNGILLDYGLDGSVAGEFVGHTGEILALAVAPRAERLLSGAADQTVKLWNLKTHELLATLFFAGDDWIIWTPQGYFYSSPNGDRLVGWRINQGKDQAARYVTARQLRQHLHSPEIVRRAIIGGSARAAAQELRGRDNELEELLTRKPPAFDIRMIDRDAPEGQALIEVTGASLEEVESWGYSVLVNDRRVRSTRMGGVDGRLVYAVPLEVGENRITVAGRDDFGYVTERSAVALSKKRDMPEKRGKLYVAVVGVNTYPNLPEACGGKACDLAYPVADALEFLNVVKQRSAPLYTGMETLVMVSGDALAADAPRQQALSLFMEPGAVLEPDARTVSGELVDFLARPGPEDTTVIFVAGHGMNLEEQYYLLPSDAQKRGDRWRTSSLVDWSVIQEEISFAQGRRILVLDTCHAANAFNAKLEKEAADARVIVFSATAANNTAGERPDLGHGIFTYAMLEGLRGAAARAGEGVRLLGLADYVYHEVVRLSRNKQEPFYHISQSANFLVAQ